MSMRGLRQFDKLMVSDEAKPYDLQSKCIDILT